MKSVRPRLAAALAFAAVVGSGVAQAQTASTIKIGGMCDRTGSTKIIGVEICPGVADYIALVNRKGGVLDQKIEYRRSTTRTWFRARSKPTNG